MLRNPFLALLPALSITLWGAVDQPAGQAAGQAAGRTLEEVIQAYVKALGGQAAVDRITTRELEMSHRHGPKATMYWQAPNRVLRIKNKERQGFDGHTAWSESKRKKVSKLPHSSEQELLTDANPIRFVHLKDTYPDVRIAPRETLDSQPMDVLAAPNNLGSTKFYFDASKHLLVHIEEFGETSAYYKHVTDFSDYREVDGVKLPFVIQRTSEEPGAENGELRISKVKQNVELNASVFKKPTIVGLVSGGKR